MSAIVVVLGDIGRSPRTCYHALSLAAHGVNVELVGYLENAPHALLGAHEKIRMVAIKPPPSCLAFVPALRALWLLIYTSWILLFATSKRTSIVLMQNPPGIPTMAVCYIASYLKGASFVIDWHNYTHSVLAATNRPFYARLAVGWEKFFGKLADHSLCVTRAMQRELKQQFRVNASVLYDRAPAGIFKPYNKKEKQQFLREFIPRLSVESVHKSESLNTHTPFVLVSCTSWTEDEDFQLLLDALEAYDSRAAAPGGKLPPLLAIITGKGPLKEYYLAKIREMRCSSVSIATPWLVAEDYPKLLASADLGVSLHTSTSGVDLPMKIVRSRVVDMFGAGLPVVSKQYPAIGELVLEGENGLLFDTAQQLKEAIVSLSEGFPTDVQKLDEMRAHLANATFQAWETQWDELVWPIMNREVSARGIALSG